MPETNLHSKGRKAHLKATLKEHLQNLRILKRKENISDQERSEQLRKLKVNYKVKRKDSNGNLY
ncbi:hypothetical protein GWK08_16305 [Leptobacterium flavescens]|uniref:Uncharacterized protein n=1 Tax=Leptobacterium flavescens TaxID=472055 RepID=A0A6P0UT65_9FLAO|nr:hypothetical protein [Leptobacterium flavescens]NER15019.1 hypothetical protein [Leptobacterium flavescens]